MGKEMTNRAELTSDQSPVFHCGQRKSLQDWTVSLSLWLHLLSSPPASAAFRHTAPLRRVPPPQLLEHCSTNIWISACVNTYTATKRIIRLTYKTLSTTTVPLTRVSSPSLLGYSLHGNLPYYQVCADRYSSGHQLSGPSHQHGWFWHNIFQEYGIPGHIALYTHSYEPHATWIKRHKSCFLVLSHDKGRKSGHWFMSALKVGLTGNTNPSSHSALQGSVMTAGLGVPWHLWSETTTRSDSLLQRIFRLRSPMKTQWQKFGQQVN